MLVLGRKENESILIGDNIRITIVGRSGSQIRIGVEAPTEVKVMRGELVAEADCRRSRGNRNEPQLVALVPPLGTGGLP